MFNLGPMEMIIVMGIAVLLFGKRLPEVGRTLGKGIVEFRKGLNGLGEDFDISGTGSSSSSSSHSSSPWRSDEHSAAEAGYTDASVPKFELPATESTTTAAASSPTPPTMEYQPPPHD